MPGWARWQFAWDCCSRAKAGDLPGDFLEKYRAATADYSRCYSNASMSGTLLREYPQAKKKLEQRTRTALPRKMRLDITTTAQENMGATVGMEINYIATPEGALETWHTGDVPRFQNARELPYAETKSKIETLCPLLSPFKAVGQGTMLDVLSLDNVRIHSYQPIKRGNQTLIKIVYDELDGPRKPIHRSWCLLSPDEGWAMREYWRISGEGDAQRVRSGKLDYDRVYRGAALVQRLETWEDRGAKRVPYSHEIIEITSFDTRTPDKFYFTGFAF